MPAGRPQIYTDDFIKQEAKALLQYVITEEIPYLKDFCFSRGYSSQRISEFTKVEEFSEALYRFKDKFESIIVIKGLQGKINSFMANNTLKNCCGWRDRPEQSDNEELINEMIEVINKKQSIENRIAQFSN